MNVRFSVCALAIAASILACSSADAPAPAPAASSAPAADAPDGSSAAPAETTQVVVKNFGFAPQTVTIKAGQTVEWNWTSGSHNVVSGAGCAPDGKFSSGAVTTAPATFKHTFDAPGTYDYFCDPHCSMGMVGKVIVE
jgi:plastocyanin